MKKILLTLAAVAALTSFASCKKEIIGSDLAKAPKTVEITILNGSVTKAVTAPAAGSVCAIADLTALFADATGNVVESKNFAGLTATDGKYIFADLPSTVSQVAVIALRGNDVPATVNAAKTLWQNTEMVEAAADQLIVYGEDLNPSSTKTDEGYVLSASVSVVPNHARIEVTSISCRDMGTYSDINLRKMTLKGYENYAAALSANLSSSSDMAVAGEDLVWSWNIKKQNVTDLILDMNVTGNGYTVAVPERTLTVDTYSVGGNEITTFETGNVYKFNIEFAASDLAEDGSATVSASVTVTISEWTINETSVGFAN